MGKPWLTCSEFTPTLLLTPLLPVVMRILSSSHDSCWVVASALPT